MDGEYRVEAEGLAQKVVEALRRMAPELRQAIDAANRHPEFQARLELINREVEEELNGQPSCEPGSGRVAREEDSL